MRHKHADLIKAYAEDISLKIQCRTEWSHEWQDCTWPCPCESFEYRIKPKPVTKEEAKKTFDEIFPDLINAYSKELRLIHTFLNQ